MTSTEALEAEKSFRLKVIGRDWLGGPGGHRAGPVDCRFRVGDLAGGMGLTRWDEADSVPMALARAQREHLAQHEPGDADAYRARVQERIRLGYRCPHPPLFRRRVEYQGEGLS